MKKNLHIIIVSVLFSIILWVSISLSYDYYATFQIPIKLVDFPNGYATGTQMPDDISVKLKGKGWKLVTAELGSESNYIIPVGKKTGKRTINLYNYLVENQWLSSDVEVINISPDTLSFFVEKTLTRKLPIETELNLEFKPGYGLASPTKLTPDSTLVTGPVSYLKNLKEIPTENISLKEMYEKTIKIVSLKKISGMSYADSKVIVNLDVEKIVDKNVHNLRVNVIDMPKDRDVVLLPNKITLSVRGGIEILGRVDTSNFSAYVNYRDVVLDTVGSVAPHIKIPPNVSLIYVKPERLRYIIKRFN